MALSGAQARSRLITLLVDAWRMQEDQLVGAEPRRHHRHDVARPRQARGRVADRAFAL